MFDAVRAGLQRGDNTTLLLLILSVLTLLLVLGWLILAALLMRQQRRLQALTRGIDGRNLEEVFAAHLETVARVDRRMDAVEQAVAVLQAQIPHCLQKISLLRYDAFDDVGGEQSFTVALLDQRGDGILLTSVYSRMDVRVYAKSIRNGRASHTLSAEEERVLRGAE